MVRPEVQVFGTQIDVENATKATQSFSTTADAGETVGGSFLVSYMTAKGYLYGAPIIIPCDIGPSQLKGTLQRHFPILGTLDVSRVANTKCVCENAWTWSISQAILDSSGVIQLFITNRHGLIGEGATVSAAQLDRVPEMLHGSFAIINPLSGARSREVSYNASSEFLKLVIQSDLGIQVVHVRDSNKISNMPGLGRTWTVTFGSYDKSPSGPDFNVPNLRVSYEHLTGIGSMAWNHVATEGHSQLGGQFALSLRGSHLSCFIPYNASARILQSALEDLESVNKVTISPRENLSGDSRVYGFRWKITFDSVNKMTEYGWLESGSDNLPYLYIESQLVGLNPTFEVEYLLGSGESDIQGEWRGQDIQGEWRGQREGGSGINTGTVYVFAQQGDEWVTEASLNALDFHSLDEFGHSVGLLGDRLIIGSPAKLVEGLFEQQALTCYGPAYGGYFTVEFRGFKSDRIPYNASAQQIHDSIVGEYGSTNKVHSISAITIDGSSDWGEVNGFCTAHKRQLLVTFVAPNGAGLSTATNQTGDLELLVIDNSALDGAFVNATESQKGTRSPVGISLQNNGTTGKQSGSAYIFHRIASCDTLPCAYSWSQEVKLSPLDAGEVASDSARFGWSVSLSKLNNSYVALVGSPGWSDDTGKVYTFYERSTVWLAAEVLTEKAWGSSSPGNEFGYAVAAESNYVLVGAPGYGNGDGAVYVFRRARNGRFLASQRLVTAKTGGRFGHALALRKDASEAVVCAPDEKTSGKCYLYLQNKVGEFRFSQVLVPSNVKPRDRFGWSCAISEKEVILIGQLELSSLSASPERPVQIVKTYTDSIDCPVSLGGTFQLTWKAQNNPLYTSALPSDATSHMLRKALEQDLHCGSVNVTRSEVSDQCGGYSWFITFNDADSYRLQGNGIPVLGCSAYNLSGSASGCSVNVTSNIAKPLRSKAHVFKKQHTGLWEEQAFLFPHRVQRQDWFGYSIAIDGYSGIVGAPNRDFLNVNSGAGFVYDLRFVSISFDDRMYNGLEGEYIEVKLHRENPFLLGQHILGLATIARNADDGVQADVNNLYSFRAEEVFPRGKTSTDLLFFSTASGRPGGNTLWIDGMYDYRGISDYSSIEGILLFDENQTSASVVIATTNDQILEKPDENITLQLRSPGMFASILGDLMTTVTLEDNNDGLNYYDKLYGEDTTEADRFGCAIDILGSADVMIVGSEWAYGLDSNKRTVINAGKAYIFTKKLSGKWSQTAILSPDSNNVVEEGRFGASVSINKPYGRDDMTALVGAPGQGKVFVFSFNLQTSLWALQSELAHIDTKFATAPSAIMFGEKNAVKILGDLAFVGAAGVETVFIYRRSFGSDQKSVTWTLWMSLRSSEYDYDLYDNGFTIQHVHKQHFGISVAAHGRTLMVGAPYSDYGNRGNVLLREFSDTDGIDNEGLGKGNVYVFQSVPHVQLVTFSCDENVILCTGSFRLQLPQSSRFSGTIECDAKEQSFMLALEEINSIGEIRVRRVDEVSGRLLKRNWWVSFISKVDDDVPLLKPLWYGFGCLDCEPFELIPNSTSTAPFLKVRRGGNQQEYLETQKLQGADTSSGDSFGYSLSIDGTQAIVGAVHSSVLTRTTWGFESGNLIGWTATGHSFDFQPTFGDNSRHRWVYGGYADPEQYTKGQPQRCSLKGRYYIGTYERRPGWQVNYVEPDPLFPPGYSVGDGPMGTLTSDPFMILGSSISFLIGGGCNRLTEYVELLVDGFPSMRATGKCSEQMSLHDWDVSDFLYRSGQIRIVDSGSEEWDHINVDEFVFSWNVEGTCADSFGGSCNAGGGYGSRTYGDPTKQNHIGKDETPSAGSAYIFIHKCQSDDVSCTWQEQARIVSSDKRARNTMGFSVAIDDVHGIALVGSIYSPAYGFYKEIPSEYPHRNATPVVFPVSSKLENYHKVGDAYAASGGSLRLIDHILRMRDGGNSYQTKSQILDVPAFAEKAGAVYLFKRVPPEIGIYGEVLKESFWLSTEHGRVAPPDVAARDTFGYSLALAGDTAVIGAIGVDGVGNDGGAAYVIEMRWRSIRFVKSEYVILEGGAPFDKVHIFVQRDSYGSNDEESIGFSTSDLSARGVDPKVFSICNALPFDHRCNAYCGDYERTSGELFFAIGETIASFSIKIMDDSCHEREMKYLQIQLHIPGGGPIHGENYRAHVRIDDNDWTDDQLACCK